MADSKRYNLSYRRQREGKTNYKTRLNLLKSGIPRLIIRRTNKYFILQIATYDKKGDLITINAHSSELKGFGWMLSAGNLPAAYLTGYLMGMRIVAADIPQVIGDFGLQNVSHKGALFGVLKGVLDAGVNIPVNKEFLPGDDRISGEHIKSYSSKAKGNQFSRTKSEASSINNLFAKVKKSIEEGVGKRKPAHKKQD